MPWCVCVSLVLARGYQTKHAWLTSTTTETAVVDKPAEEADDHGHGHHHH
jgi:hypothetical protein